MTGSAPGWRTSSFSSNGASCVEVLEAPDVTYVRDTKERGAGPVLRLDRPAWTTFLDQVAGDAAADNGALETAPLADGGRALRAIASGEVLRFTATEWDAFRRGVLAGEFGGPSQPG